MSKESPLAEQIKYLKTTEGLSLRQIAKQLRIGRRRCSQIYYNDYTAERNELVSMSVKYQDLFHDWYQENSSLKAKQIYWRLKQRNEPVSYRSVARWTRHYRRKKSKCYSSLNFLSGEEGQVDWFFLNHKTLGKLCGFILVLSYSRFAFAHIFPRASFEFFIQGHILAFEAFGGLPRALRYDNLKSVVLSREPLRYNPAFLEFVNYYGFEIRLCNPASGNEKGRVERLIRSLRDTFLNTSDSCQTINALNLALYEWIAQRNQAKHRTTERIPSEMKAEEQLRHLPYPPYINRHIHSAQYPTKTGLIIFDTNKYSIPEYLVSQQVTIYAYCSKIEAYDLKGNRVATHPRCFLRNQEIINPLHRSFARISVTAKADRIFNVIRNMDLAVKSFLLANEQVGEDPKITAYNIFKILPSHSRALILSAIREAISRKIPKWSFISSCLSNKKDQTSEEVNPIYKDLLLINYKPRPLSEY